MTSFEEQAREANKPENWDVLWEREGQESWRGQVLDTVYARIEDLIPKGSKIVDIGGGVGIFADRLRKIGCSVSIMDISPAAVRMAQEQGFEASVVDVEDPGSNLSFDSETVVISTECLEHLSQTARDRVVAAAAKAGRAFFTVPNDRLGPEVEPQHTIQFTAMSFKRQLQKHFKDVRIEVIGPYDKPFVPAFLLAVCGFPKSFTLSFTMPVRNEEKDIERTLASFRAAADEIVIGIDPRSTDGTRAIAEKYADIVFDLVDPQGPPEDRAPKVHFSWIRNQCMDKCTGDWIFMSEGHESLKKGTDTLLNLDRIIPKGAKVGFVWRTGTGQRWAFPWLTRGDDTRLRYFRQTHNDLQIPDDVLRVKLPQVETWHFRDHEAEAARAAQRKVQNRLTLMDDWLSRGSTHSLFYLASEWRDFNPEKALDYFKTFLESSNKIGDARYQARLIVAKEYSKLAMDAREKGDLGGFASFLAEARKVLIPATEDNWWRTEHWLWLGDIAAEQEFWEEAIQFYKYSATQIGNPPFIMWWIDDDAYTYWPAQRLASAYSALGYYEDALFWAKRVLELLPEDVPEEITKEAQANVAMMEEAIHESD